MRLATASVTVLCLALFGGCQGKSSEQAPDGGELHIVQPAYGANAVFHEALSAAAGHELIVTDLSLGPDAVGEAHFHPWEEYLYVLGGSAVLDIEGLEPRTLVAGETFVIPPNTVHTPRAGPEGIRAMVIRVHDEGDPVSLPAPDAP